jgi:hypothetical protein
VLKLVYHTAVFGPIDLEYDRPVIRVGSSEDNDLVLRHPSVQPHHCQLGFRGEKVVFVPLNQNITSEVELWRLPGPEFGAGNRIRIGEVEFTLAHSSKSVAIPEAWSRATGTSGSEGIEDGDGKTEAGYFCPKCRVFRQESEVRRVGLVGHAKRLLCPKCSTVLDGELAQPQKPPTAPKGGVLRKAVKLKW